MIARQNRYRHDPYEADQSGNQGAENQSLRHDYSPLRPVCSLIRQRLRLRTQQSLCHFLDHGWLKTRAIFPVINDPLEGGGAITGEVNLGHGSKGILP